MPRPRSRRTPAHHYPRADVTYVPVTNADPAVVSLAWRPGPICPAVKAFIETSREVAAKQPDAKANGEGEKIVIVDYDSTWPARFELERDRVQRALGCAALRIEHIGSTAVPGLAAKPIVDLLVTVENPDDETVTVPALESAGYELRVREPGHRMFRTRDRDVTCTSGETRIPTSPGS